MKRSAGVLLPVFSLPSAYGIGCLSQAAYDCVDWLADCGQTYLQILPLGPTGFGGSADSPYQSFSAFAGNPYFISLEDLIEEGTLTKAECDAVNFGSDPGRIDYEKLHDGRLKLLRKAYERSNISQNPDYQRFTAENGWWLEDYALFMAVRQFFGEVSWNRWPEDIRFRWNHALDYYRRELYFEVEFQRYLQFQFFRQWKKLKDYANEKHISIVGDVPIYVSADSADVWAHPELFRLDENREMTVVAGCPPDDFSADGQLWGNPLYRWDYHRETGYGWWTARMEQSFRLYDMVRIDHFRGFDEYFSIPAGSETALAGKWQPGPGMELFRAIHDRLGDVPILAEDLGLMTDSVRKLVKDSGYPNMKVLGFAFDAADTGFVNDHLPHNYRENCFVYTGTHDNETLVGWLSGLDKETRKMVREYVQAASDKGLHKKLIGLAMLSCAKTCIVPVQDYLGLDNTARMNQPGTVVGNWSWRMEKDALTEELGREVLALTKRYGRMNWAAAAGKDKICK